MGMFRGSKLYKKAKKLLKEIQKGTKPADKPNFEFLRNVIMLQIEISKGNRAGDVSNMTLDEFSLRRGDRRRTKRATTCFTYFIGLHKAISALFSMVNFHGHIFKLVQRYISVFSRDGSNGLVQAL